MRSRKAQTAGCLAPHPPPCPGGGHARAHLDEGRVTVICSGSDEVPQTGQQQALMAETGWGQHRLGLKPDATNSYPCGLGSHFLFPALCFSSKIRVLVLLKMMIMS